MSPNGASCSTNAAASVAVRTDIRMIPTVIQMMPKHLPGGERLHLKTGVLSP